MRKSDYIIILAFALMLGAHGITQFLIGKSTTTAQDQKAAKEIINYVEANPIAAYAFQSKKLSFVYSYVLAPGIVGGYYYWIRKKYQSDMFIVETYAFTVLIICLIDFANDFSYLIGFLAR